MATHHYTEVPTIIEPYNEGIESSSRKYFFRQLFLSSGMWTPYFAVGLCMGTPTVYIPQVRREANSTEAVSVEMASWLSSTYAYASVPWCIIMAFLMDYIGRRKSIIIVSFNQILVATSYYLSTTPTHILIAEVLQGLTHGSTVTVCIISIVEYTSAKYRGVLLTIKSATVFWGIWAANAIGTFAPWRYILVLTFLSAFYSLTVFIWPESPSWLAKKGKYEECRKSHRRLKGRGADSERELEELINTQMEERKIKRKLSLRNLFGFFLDKTFYHPVSLSALMILVYQLSGKFVVTLYALDIIKKITSSESTAYGGMLILDGVSVFSMYGGCLLSRVLRRRFLLFFFGSLAVMFLLITSLYLYLIHLSYISENKYVSVCLLIGFSVSIGTGPMILATSLYGEMVPLRYKGQATVVIGWVFVIVQSILLKNTPYIFKYFDMHGMFLFNGICVSVCLSVLYKYLPETKDKTLQEIEMFFKG